LDGAGSSTGAEREMFDKVGKRPCAPLGSMPAPRIAPDARQISLPNIAPGTALNIHELPGKKAVPREKFGRGRCHAAIPAMSVADGRQRAPKSLADRSTSSKGADPCPAGPRARAGGAFKVVKSIDDVEEGGQNACSARRFVTPPELVLKVKSSTGSYIEEGSAIDKEFYLSMLVDREVLRASRSWWCRPEGGHGPSRRSRTNTPEKIITITVDPGGETSARIMCGACPRRSALDGRSRQADEAL